MLVDALLEANRRSPDRVAVDDGAAPLNYGQLVRLATVLRHVVARETTCERVGIMLPASSLFPAALFGVLWASKVAVPLNFLLNPDELARVVDHAALDLILTIRPFQDVVAPLSARMLRLEDLGLKRKAVAARWRRTPDPPSVDPGATAVILYTSGTTGEPKGVELTHRNLYSNSIDAIHSLIMDPRQTFLNVLPPFHIFGLTTGVLIPSILGTTTYAIPRFSPLTTVKTVAEKKLTIMMAIPSMFAAILRVKSAGPDAFRSIQLAMSGGEPLPERVRVGFEERFGVVLREGFGMTETSPVVAACSVNAHRPGTVGRPIRNVAVRIVADNGRDVDPGEQGEILVRGPGVMKGYYKRPDETNRVIDSQGWFHTGDLGRVDPDGFLSITGRAKEMLIIGGENVSPREIEAVLETHDAVLQAAVIGMPDPLRGESPMAFVMPQPSANVTERALRQHARVSLAGFKVPKRIVIREDLPQSSTGKILKRRLPELL